MLVVTLLTGQDDARSRAIALRGPRVDCFHGVTASIAPGIFSILISVHIQYALLQKKMM